MPSAFRYVLSSVSGEAKPWSKNVKIRFNLNNENDRKAYDYLQGVEKSYSKAVISAICEYLGLSERTATEDAFLKKVITTIKEELAKTNPFGLLQLVQTPPAQISTEKENTETEEMVMDFLDNF